MFCFHSTLPNFRPQSSIIDYFLLSHSAGRLRGTEVRFRFKVAASDLRQRLAHPGWRGPLVNIPYVFTNGRVYIRGAITQHGKKLRVDALLRAEASLPIAAVQTVHAGQTREEVISRLKEYAHQRLAVPFAYLWEKEGECLYDSF